MGLALAGAITAAGLALLLAACAPARRDARALITAIDATPSPIQGSARPVGPAVLRLAAAIGRTLPAPSSRDADLAITGRSYDSLLLAQLTGATLGLCAPVVIAAAAALTGATLPWVTPLWVGACLAVAGWLAPQRQLHAAATRQRRAQRAAVSGYLDLVALRAAAGAALVDALTDAAAIGTGPVYAALRRALADTRAQHSAPTAALHAAGRELGLPVLTDLAARLTLVEAAGALSSGSLSAQAAALRDGTLADTHGAANEASEAMLIAQVVLGFGFLLFLGYPALARVAAL